MKLRRVLVALMVGAHRALFTLATALLGVSASLVAGEPHTAAYYCLLIGALLLMYVEDECGEIEVASRALGGSGVKTDARNDLFDTHNTVLLLGLAGVSVVLLVGGFGLLALL
jgi:hypothetical protein